MAEYPGRLNERLNSDWEPEQTDIERARRLVGRIASNRISKYNAQSLTPPRFDPAVRRVLVCDQTFADAATVYGMIDETGFQDMLVAAIQENPDAEILVKTHPDTGWTDGKRRGYFDQLEEQGNVRILRDPINPFVLFEQVDTVYVGNSHMGLEALLAGKKVVTFGAPFYGGWGLTDDRIAIPHRRRERSLEALFLATYDWYTIYNVPGCSQPSRIEDALDYIEEHRPVPDLHGVKRSNTPKVSVVIPAYNVEPYLASCISSVQRQTLADLEIIVVNDASTDGTLSVAQKLAAEDPRIDVIDLPENVGQGFSRNQGTEQARGEYVWFLDSDDTLNRRNFLEKLVAESDQNQTQMLRGRKAFERVVNTDGRVVADRPDYSERHFDGLDAVSGTVSDVPQIYHSRHFWLWLFRRDFLRQHDIRFQTRNWEERAFLTRALLKADRLGVMDLSGVVYLVREDSTARRVKSLTDLRSMVSNLSHVVEDLLEAGAENPESPFHDYYRFNLTQFTHYICKGFTTELFLQSGNAEVTAEMGRAANAFRNAQFSPDLLVDTPDVLDRIDWESGQYHVLLAALRAEAWGLYRLVAQRGGIDQRALFAEFEQDQSERVKAVNRYFVNERVKPARPQNALLKNRPRLVLHIGATKTGSTFLQHWLTQNRPGLLKQGIYVPERGIYAQPGRPHKTGGHAEFLKAAERGENSLALHIKAAVEARETIHTVVLSSEAFFFLASPSTLTSYLSDFDLSVLCYLRRQDDWANSQYCEFVGGGALGRTSLSPEAWLETPRIAGCLDYETRMNAWAEVVGDWNTNVRSYDALKKSGTLLDDFAESIGVSDLASLLAKQPESRNEVVLSETYLKLARAFNSMPFESNAAYLGFIEDVHETSRQNDCGSRGQPSLISAQTRAALMERHASGNAKAAQRFLGSKDGFHFDPVSASEPGIDAAPIAVESLLDILEAYKSAAPKNKVGQSRHEPAALPERSRSLLRPAKLATTSRDLLLLMRSPLFDRKWYIKNNQDLTASRMPVELHYLLYGSREGRDPGPDFSTKKYFSNYPDVKSSGQNALVHYLRFGRREGRSST